MHMTAGSPTRSTRPWADADRHGIIVVGEDHETGSSEASPARYGALEEWTRSNFDVESFEYRWSAQDFIPADGMPYIGRSPRTTRSEEHTSELQSLMRISYAVFCLKKKKYTTTNTH